MKTKLLIVLMAAALMLTISGTTQALSLQPGPYFQKTLNYEVGTSYSGGTNGVFYFRTAATSYYTEEYGLLTYGDRASDKLFSDATLSIAHTAGLKCDDGTYLWDPINKPNVNCIEDTFGLIRTTTIAGGNVATGIGADSRFGDGSDATPVGNNITAGAIYWAEGLSEDNYIRGILYGGQDQVVEVLDSSTSSYRIWSAGSQADMYLIDGDAAYDPSQSGSPMPTARTADDEFPGWFDDTTDPLILSAELEYFRYQGSTVVNPQGEPVFDGQTEVVADLQLGKNGSWDDMFANWWDSPDATPATFDPTGDMWQSWNIGDPFTYGNGWTGSEDSGRAYIIPEPMTMLGVFLGVSSLTGYLRKRRMA